MQSRYLIMVTVVMRMNQLYQCLLKLDMDMFCSGGANICLWHNNGTLLSNIVRKEKDRE